MYAEAIDQEGSLDEEPAREVEDGEWGGGDS